MPNAQAGHPVAEEADCPAQGAAAFAFGGNYPTSHVHRAWKVKENGGWTSLEEDHHGGITPPSLKVSSSRELLLHPVPQFCKS